MNITKLVITLFLTLSFHTLSAEGHKSVNKEAQQQREQIMNAKIAFFTSEMDLTPEEAQVFWPVYNEFFKELNRAHRNTKIALHSLKKLIDQSASTEQIAEQLSLYTKNYEKEGEVYMEYSKKFLKILSPEKVAKLYLSEDAFREKMIDLLKEPKTPNNPSKQREE